MDIPWHEIPIIGDLGGYIANGQIFQQIWMPIWTDFAYTMNQIIPGLGLWHP